MPGAPREPAQTPRRRLARSPNTDRDLPEAVRRAMRLELSGHAMLCCGLIAIWLLGRHGVVPLFAPAWIFALFPVIVGWAFLCQRRVRRTVRRAAAADHLRCPDCLYDFRTLDAAGACSECGRAYEHAAVRAQWLDAQRRLKGAKEHAP